MSKRIKNYEVERNYKTKKFLKHHNKFRFIVFLESCFKTFANHL